MKKSKVLIVSMILGVLYSIYIIGHFGTAMTSGDSAEVIGASLATALVLPHMLVASLGAIFSVIAVIINKAWSGLTAMILYFVSGVLFIPYAVFSIPLGLFALFGWLNMRKIQNKKETEVA